MSNRFLLFFSILISNSISLFCPISPTMFNGVEKYLRYNLGMGLDGFAEHTLSEVKLKEYKAVRKPGKKHKLLNMHATNDFQEYLETNLGKDKYKEYSEIRDFDKKEKFLTDHLRNLYAEHLNPLIGLIALDERVGLIHNLRLFGSFKHQKPKEFSDKLHNDSGKDLISKILKIFFPGRNAQLGTTETFKELFEYAEERQVPPINYFAWLLWYVEECRKFRDLDKYENLENEVCILNTNFKLNLGKYKKNDNKSKCSYFSCLYLSDESDSNEEKKEIKEISELKVTANGKEVLKQICRFIICKEESEVFYPKHIIEIIIHAFVVKRFENSDLENYLIEIARIFGGNRKDLDIKPISYSDIKDIINNKNCESINSLEEAWKNAFFPNYLESSLPYVIEPIAHGASVCEVYNRLSGNLESEEFNGFPDCVETVARHFFNSLAFAPQDQQNEPRFELKDSLAEDLKYFYQNIGKDPADSNNGSVAKRSEWNKVVGDIQDENIIYNHNTNPRRDLKAGIINFINILKKLCNKTTAPLLKRTEQIIDQISNNQIPKLDIIKRELEQEIIKLCTSISESNSDIKVEITKLKVILPISEEFIEEYKKFPDLQGDITISGKKNGDKFFSFTVIISNKHARFVINDSNSKKSDLTFKNDGSVGLKLISSLTKNYNQNPSLIECLSEGAAKDSFLAAKLLHRIIGSNNDANDIISRLFYFLIKTPDPFDKKITILPLKVKNTVLEIKIKTDLLKEEVEKTDIKNLCNKFICSQFKYLASLYEKIFELGYKIQYDRCSWALSVQHFYANVISKKHDEAMMVGFDFSIQESFKEEVGQIIDRLELIVGTIKQLEYKFADPSCSVTHSCGGFFARVWSKNLKDNVLNLSVKKLTQDEIGSEIEDQIKKMEELLSSDKDQFNFCVYLELNKPSWIIMKLGNIKEKAENGVVPRVLKKAVFKNKDNQKVLTEINLKGSSNEDKLGIYKKLSNEHSSTKAIECIEDLIEILNHAEKNPELEPFIQKNFIFDSSESKENDCEKNVTGNKDLPKNPILNPCGRGAVLLLQDEERSQEMLLES